MGRFQLLVKILPFDGTKLNTIFEYKTTGISINEIDKYFKFLRPDYMKIDDGNRAFNF